MKIEEFEKMIMEHIEEYAGYYCEVPYIRDIDDVHDYILDMKINGETLESMSDEKYNYYCNLLNKIDMGKIEDLVWDLEHPYDPFREFCDADFYGV